MRINREKIAGEEIWLAKISVSTVADQLYADVKELVRSGGR